MTPRFYFRDDENRAFCLYMKAGKPRVTVAGDDYDLEQAADAEVMTDEVAGLTLDEAADLLGVDL